LGQIGIHHLERITSGKTEKRINEIPNACEIAFVHADERGKWMKSGWKFGGKRGSGFEIQVGHRWA